MSRNYGDSGGGKLTVAPWQQPRHRPTEKETSGPGISLFVSPQSPITRQVRRVRDLNTTSNASSPGGSSSGSSYSSDCYTPQCFRSPSKQNLNASSPKKKNKTKNFKELTSIDISEDDKLSKWIDYFSNVDAGLIKYYKSPDELFDKWNEVCALRQALENAGKHIMKKSVSVFNIEDLGTRIWMAGYYQCIVVLRRKKTEAESESVERSTVKTYFSWMLQKGIDYFHELIEVLQVNYGLMVNNVVNDMTEEIMSGLPKEAYHGIHILSKIHACLGDLYRYYGSKHHLDTARENYELTRRLFPYKGRGYTQLAQIAVCRSDIISNVYYTMRALTAKYPSDGCHNNLIDIFDKTYRLYKDSYKSSWYYLSKWVDKKQHGRKEVWIFPWLPKPEPKFLLIPRTKQEHISELSSTERFQRFVISYVHLIGKLYTKIGTDDIEIVAENALVYFEGYLLDTHRVKFHRLMQIASMNMYVLHTLQVQNSKAKSRAGEHFEEIFMGFFLEMLSLVVEKLDTLIRHLQWNSSLMHTYSAFILVLLSCLIILLGFSVSGFLLSVCCQWLQLHPGTWIKPHYRPTFCIRRIENRVEENDKSREDDVWIAFASLLTRIVPCITRYSKVLFPILREVPEETYCLKLTFPERTTFGGFICFEEALKKQRTYYIKKTARKEKAQIYARLRALYCFGVDLLLKYKVIDVILKPHPLMEFVNVTSVRKPKKSLGDELKCGLDREHLHYWTLDLRRDKAKAAVTEIRKRRPDVCNARIILRNHPDGKMWFPPAKTKPNPVVPVPPMPVYEIHRKLSYQRIRTDIIITPKQIVLDTNCFVLYMNHVMLLTRLVATPILVPVSVILELKGLSKGGFTVKDRKKFKSETDPGAAEQLVKNQIVARTCKIALMYVNAYLGSKFLVVTCYGRIAYEMRSILRMIKDDYYDKVRTNDERILDACIYMEGLDKALREKDRPYRVYRNSIVLTSDRMMHICSFDNNIPARHITAFTFWILKLWAKVT